MEADVFIRHGNLLGVRKMRCLVSNQKAFEHPLQGFVVEVLEINGGDTSSTATTKLIGVLDITMSSVCENGSDGYFPRILEYVYHAQRNQKDSNASVEHRN